VIHAIAHILLAKLYKKPIDAAQNLRYKRFCSSAAVTRQTELIRGARGNKRFFGPEGRFFNLEEVFDSLNGRFFGGLLGRPELTWSESAWPSGPWATMTPPTTPSWSAASSTGLRARAMPSSTFSTTRCCT
jgi:hypothetical protein